MTLSGSVVANTNFTCSGGSSTVLSRALKPCVDTMWASSRMKILYLSRVGANVARSRRSRASSTPPWLAASISTTSSEPGPPRASSTHDGHRPHGSGVGPCSQLRQRARIRALVVFPQPRGPENRYACEMRPVRSACTRGAVTCSWPMTSAKVSGRYRRYRAWVTTASVGDAGDARHGHVPRARATLPAPPCPRRTR